MPYTPPLLARGLAIVAGVLLTHASPGADPGIGEWTTFGNGPSHSGFYPKVVGSASFTAGWSKSFPTSVNPVAVSGDTVYATTSGYFAAGMRAFAMKASDGAEKWSFPLADAFAVNAPTYANGRVYFQRSNHSGDTHLWSLDASSGTLRFAALHEAQWGSYAAPTIADGGAFINGGYYGGMYGFDAATGSQRFFISDLPQRDGWTPSYANGVVYSCVYGVFTAYNPQTGNKLWTHDCNTTSTGSTSYWYEGNIPAISDDKAAIIGGGRLVIIDLATRTQLWSLPGLYNGTPAFAEGKVYAFEANQVKAYDATNGTLLGTYTGSGSFLTQPLVTKDLVLASNGTNTFVFDRATFALRQTLNAGGTLSYAAGKLYVVNTPWNSPATLATFNVVPQEADPAGEPLPPISPPQPHPNPDRPLGATTVAWLDAVKAGGIMYFLFDNPAKIERYNLATGAWLAPISLPEGPKGFTASDSAIYVSFGNGISRFPLDGTTETPLGTTAFSIKSLFEIDGRLYLANPGGYRFLCIDPTDGTFLDAMNYSYSVTGLSVAPGRKKLFARTTGVSPSDIRSIALNADGSFGIDKDSPYHGDYPNATGTFVFPGEAKVVDNSGIVYSTGDLTYVGSLAGAFTDIDFNGDSPILLRGNDTLVGYSAGLLQTGRKTIAANQQRIAIGGGFAHAFARQDGRGVVATKIALNEIGPGNPGPGIDPTSLTYTPDAIEFGTDTVFLLSRLHQSIFRWSISRNRYLSSIPLAEIPQRMAYSATIDRIYLSYPGGRITKVNLPTGTNEEEFVSLPQTASGLQTAGEYLFACDPSNWATHYIFSPAGALISVNDYAEFSNGYAWSAANRRMYFLRDGSSPNDLHWESIDVAGKFGQEGETPYHGTYVVRHPIRVAPDGSIVLLGNGDVYNATSLQRVGKLGIAQPPNVSPPYSADPAVVDAAWLNGTLHTVRGTYLFGSTTASNGMIESWNTVLSSSGAGASRGTPLRLNALADGLLLVSLLEGRPVFAKYNASLNQVSSEPGNNPPLGSPITRANPSRPLGPTTGPWIDSTRRSGIAYFLFDQPAKLERYNLATGTWLAPISLPDGPKALCGGANGIYVSFGKTLSRFSLDGTTETALLSTASEIRPIAEKDGRIYITAESGTGNHRFGVVNTTTGWVVNEATYSPPMTGISFAPGISKLFGRSTQIVPSDILQVTINADGTLGAQTDSPHHGGIPIATRTFVFPAEDRVLDDAGSVFSASNLQFVGTLNGAFTDADFAGDQPIVLRSGSIVGYSTAFQELGRETVSANTLKLYVTNDTVISFVPTADRGVAALRTPLSEVTTPELINPTNLAYTPDSIELGNNGIVYLLSKTHQSIFRWSIAQHQYLQTIALSNVPKFMAYSETLDRLYLIDAAGVISKIDVGVEREVRPFATLPASALGLQTAGEFLLAASSRPTGEYVHYVLSAGGVKLSESSSHYNSNAYTWSPANRRMYFLRDNVSPNDIHWEAIDAEGRLGQTGESPYDGNLNVLYPIRVAPNGSALVMGNGDVYDALTLERLGGLPIPPPVITIPQAQQVLSTAVVDAGWIADTLYTVRSDFFTGGVIHRWNASRQLKASASLPGYPIRLLALPTSLLAISIKDGRPVFTTLAPDLGTPDLEPIDFTAFAGTFVASLMSDEGANGPFGGVVKLTLNVGGTASGIVRIAGKTVRFQITFDQFGHAAVPVDWKGIPCTLNLSLVMGTSGPQVEGTFESDDWSLALNGARAMGTALAGRHLFLLSDSSETVRNDIPPVVGRGSLTISRNGNVRVQASLLLGGAASQGSMLLEDGSIVLNLMTAAKSSFVTGTVMSANQLGFDWTGTLRYFKQASPNAARYRREIDTTVNLRGALYRRTNPLLPVGKNGAVTLIFDAGDLEETLMIEATLDPSGLILSEADYRLDFATINPSTGVVHGRFMHPATEEWLSFSGIVNRKLGEAQGSFLGPVHGGQVSIIPR